MDTKEPGHRDHLLTLHAIFAVLAYIAGVGLDTLLSGSDISRKGEAMGSPSLQAWIIALIAEIDTSSSRLASWPSV